MSISPTISHCYVKLKISVSDVINFESDAQSFLSSDKVKNIFKFAMDLARESGLPLETIPSKIFAYDDATNTLLNKEQPLFHYFPEQGCATIRVCIDGPITRAIISMN